MAAPSTASTAIILTDRRLANLCRQHAASTHHREDDPATGAPQVRAPLTLIADQKNRKYRPSYCRNLHSSSRSPSHALVQLRHCFARTESHSPLHASSGKCSRLARLQAFQQQLTLGAGLASRGSISISISSGATASAAQQRSMIASVGEWRPRAASSFAAAANFSSRSSVAAWR